MRRLIFPLRTSPEAEAGDDIYPALRGWPESSSVYNPSAPGTTFNDWTANVGIRTSSAPFCVSVDFNVSQPGTGTIHSFLWKPPPSPTS